MEEQIVKRYVEDLVGSVKIAREFGLQKHQVLAILKKHGIKARKTRRPDLSTEEMIRLYDEEGLNTWQIAERMDTDQTTVRKRIKKSGRILPLSSERSAARVRHKNPRWSGYGEICGSHWKSIVYQANSRSIQFDITIEYGWDLYLSQDRKCALTDVPIFFADTDYDYKRGIKNASLDRINSDDGYVIGNVQWVHKKVNLMKGSISQEDFITICKQVYLKMEKNH
jgi:transposase-like protein